MVRDSLGDFDHPKLDKGHPLERHILYRIKKCEWNNNTD